MALPKTLPERFIIESDVFIPLARRVFGGAPAGDVARLRAEGVARPT
jgi:hypothetical protein